MADDTAQTEPVIAALKATVAEWSLAFPGGNPEAIARRHWGRLAEPLPCRAQH